MTTTPQTTSTPLSLRDDDPRFAFAAVVSALRSLIDATPDALLTAPTPCPEFRVKELLEHCVLVVHRVAAIGRGEHWSSVTEQPVDSGWAVDFRDGAHAIMEAWADPAILATPLEVPWGEFPGEVLIYSYTAELAVHGWDLSRAIGVDFTIEDRLLQGALTAAKFIPSDDRGTPEMPFSAVVDPGPGASVLDQIAGWMGRDVRP